jgi:hypothetical protein
VNRINENDYDNSLMKSIMHECIWMMVNTYEVIKFLCECVHEIGEKWFNKRNI